MLSYLSGEEREELSSCRPFTVEYLTVHFIPRDISHRNYSCIMNVLAIFTNEGIDPSCALSWRREWSEIIYVAHPVSAIIYNPHIFLQIGGIVYARLAVANKDMEPELDCTDGSGHSTGLGPLNGGFMFSCSLGLCRK